VSEHPGVGRVLVIIPTYNEADNVRIIVGRVRAATAGADILTRTRPVEDELRHRA
jgi:dolichol-phosphate mannosyltransferase